MAELNLCPRKSVGAIITGSCEDKLLCLYRKKHPVGLAGVAGHLDFIDEQKQILEHPLDALKREVLEESGVIVGAVELLFNGILPNTCSICDGNNYNGHEWYVYTVNARKGLPKLMEPDKHAFLKFMSINEIMKYVFCNDVDPAWLYIWTYLGLTKALH